MNTIRIHIFILLKYIEDQLNRWIGLYSSDFLWALVSCIKSVVSIIFFVLYSNVVIEYYGKSVIVVLAWSKYLFPHPPLLIFMVVMYARSVADLEIFEGDFSL